MLVAMTFMGEGPKMADRGKADRAPSKRWQRYTRANAGDTLLALSIDPAWTPLSMSCGAVTILEVPA